MDLRLSPEEVPRVGLGEREEARVGVSVRRRRARLPAVRREPTHRPDQPVPVATLARDVQRPPRVVAERPPQQQDALRQRLVADVLVGPDALEQLVPPQEAGPRPDELHKQLQRARRQNEPLVPTAERGRSDVQLEVADPIAARGQAGRTRFVPSRVVVGAHGRALQPACRR